MLRHRLVIPLLVVPVLAAVPVVASAGPSPRAVWTTSWATSQHTTAAAVENQSVRMIVHLTQGGSSVRVRLGNTLGTSPLAVGHVTVGAVSSGAGVAPGSLRTVTFHGSRTVSVPAGRYVVSDGVRLTSRPQQDLAVSVFVPGSATPSAHGSAYQTSYLSDAGAGDRTSDTDGAGYPATTQSYLIVDAVDVLSPDVRGAVVVAGGSVTDGEGSRKTGPAGTGPAAPPNSRWSDVLARRVLHELPARAQLSVAEAGIGGNTAARVCPSPGMVAPYSNVQDRLDRDVLSLSNVRYLVLYAGTNDVANNCTADQIVAAFQDVIGRAHRHGIRVIVATVTPRAHYTPSQNEVRHAVNLWITTWDRCAGACDGTVPFDAAIAFYAYPNAIDPRLDSGDDIHPNAEGYRLMGDSIDTRLLRR